ncbi:MAG: YgaP family membrane protein [Fidelibacterota bacterium]
MKRNIGKTDKIGRWIVGLTLVGLGVFYNRWWGAIGLIPIVTALFRFCPFYSIIGLSTCEESQFKKE